MESEKAMNEEEFIKEALELFTTGYPPINSLFVLRRLEELLKLAKTNSFCYAEDKYKTLAIPYIQLLYAQVFSGKGIMFLDPASITALANEDTQDIMEKILLNAKRKIEEMAQNPNKP